MSIKAKLSLFISGIGMIILILNAILSYYLSQDALMTQAQNQLNIVAKEFGIAVEHAQYTSQYIEEQMASSLRLAAIAAEHELPPNIDDVSNEQLVALSQKLGVSHISLYKQVDGDIKALKSSDPKGINLNTKSWSFWYEALQQLFNDQRVTLSEGQALANFWSAPYDVSIPNPPHIGKWGFYYDGTTNYIIDPYMLDTQIKGFEQIVGANFVLDKTLKEHKELLEITGFDPQASAIIQEVKRTLVNERTSQSEHSILFGSYTYQDPANDLKLIKQAYRTHQTVSVEDTINNKHVIKNFIPVISQKPYVICVVIDYTVIQQMLNTQLLHQIIISLILLMGMVVFSYYIASYYIRPLDRILKKVNEISEGRFEDELPIYENNEWGVLSETIRKMSLNLDANTKQLQQTNEMLRSTKQNMESFVNHTSDAFVVVGLDGIVQQANKAYIGLYGWSMEETIGFPLHSVTESYQVEADDVMLKVKKGIPVSAFENVCQTKDGRLIDVSTTISGIRNEKDKLVAYASISRDITERRNTDELFRRSEKLSIVGQLAAGVAHEIRNPLTTLRGFVQLLHAKANGNQQHLDIMLSELDRINFIVSEFLILAKPQAINFQKRDLVFILQDIISLLASQANLNNIQFHFDFAPHIPLINCEENQLKQVFINIIKNGMESMPDGGEITIQIGNLATDDVMVRIVDQGCGISEDQLARLGEPFYTNKEAGTGLGLMVSQQIIANHKGSMHFESEIGKGTTVEIILPMS
ncbi:MAG: ATP-binding protein [Paenibacillaceae bacterium]